MTTEDPQYSASLDADINAERDVWTIVNSFNNQGQLADDQLLGALTKNRQAMNPLQRKYAELVYADGGVEKPASRERRACFKELNRLYSAIDSIKTTLLLRGLPVEFDHWDEEHPNAAYRRYLKEWEEKWAEERKAQSSCYVVTAIFGSSSCELEAAKRVCRTRFALNPIVFPSWLTYQLVGPSIAGYSRIGARQAAIAKRLVADPIVRASDADLFRALPWIAYIALPGWLAVLLIAALVHGASGG